MPDIQIVQFLRGKNYKFDDVEKIIKLCHFELSGKSLINYYTNIIKISPYGRNDSVDFRLFVRWQNLRKKYNRFFT